MSKLSPDIGAPMKSIQIEDVTVDICEETGGVWFDIGEFGRFIKRFPNVLPHLEGIAISKESSRNKIKTRCCPNDLTPLEPYQYIEAPGVGLEACPICGGLWFDDREIDEVLDTVQKRMAFWEKHGMPPEVASNPEIYPLLETLDSARSNRTTVYWLLRVFGAYNPIFRHTGSNYVLADALRLLNKPDPRLTERTNAPLPGGSSATPEPSKSE